MAVSKPVGKDGQGDRRQDMAENGVLSPRQQRAISALLASKTVSGAAKAAGVGERTIYTWLRDPGFRAALSVAEGDLLDAAVRRLLGLQAAALDTLEQVLGDTEASQAVRLRAAQTVLELTLKMREQRDTEQRLSALEQAAGALV